MIRKVNKQFIKKMNLYKDKMPSIEELTGHVTPIPGVSFKFYIDDSCKGRCPWTFHLSFIQNELSEI